jgi:signal transduction histidine kinase
VPTGLGRLVSILNNLSLQALLLIGVALIALPAALLGLIGDLRAINEARQSIVNTDLVIANVVGAFVDGTIDEARSVAWAIATGLTANMMTPAYLDPRLQRLQPVYPDFINIVVVDAKANSVGEMLPYPPGTSRVSFANVPWVQSAISQNAEQVGTTYLSPRTGRPASGVAVPVRDVRGGAIGAVVVELDLSSVETRLGSFALSSGRQVYVTDPLGQLTYASGGAAGSRTIRNLSHVPLIEGALTGGTAIQSDGPFDGLSGSWIGVASPSPRYHRVVAVIQPVDVATSVVTSTLTWDIAAVLFVLTMAGVGSYFVARRLLSPIYALEHAARAWTDGDFSVRAQPEGPREIAALGRTFNTMADSLSVTMNQLRESDARLLDERNRLQAILDTSPAGIIVIDAQGNVVLLNRAAEAVLGRSWPGPIPLSDYVAGLPICRSDGTPVSPAELPICRALHEGTPVLGSELVVRRPNGWDLHLLTNSAPIRDRHEIDGAVSVFVDITPLAEEERLRTEFVLSAAHEFRNPLTVIKGYAEVGMRDPTVRETNVYRELARILDATNRATRLADDLIDAARLHLPPLVLRKEVVDLDQLARETARRFETSAPEQPHRIVFLLQPAYVEGDPQLLSEALTHLLRQAALASPANAEILVDVRAWDGIAILSVTDHGRQISPEELPNLFSTPIAAAASWPSESRQARREVLPLYLARRIVEESGGWIRATSSPSATTVSITLPRYAPAEHDSLVSVGTTGQPTTEDVGASQVGTR